MTGKSLDVVCTIYNDEKTIGLLVDKIAEAVEPMGLPWRLILVCDGSPDGSWRELEKIAGERANVTAVELARNYGQHVAVSAGLDFSTADYVVVMDSDLQDPPSAIPALVDLLDREEYDVVYAIRTLRRDPSMKRLTSWLFWKFIRYLAGKEILADQLMMRGMSRRYVRAFQSLREHHRFIAGLSAWLGFKQGAIRIEGGARLEGRSNYNLRRLFRLAMDATTSLSVVPLRLASGLGLATTAFAFLYGGYTLLRYLFFGGLLAGFPTMVVLITGLSGIQLLILGILGEYLGRVLRESQRRPLYFVRQVRGAGAAAAAATLPLPPTPPTPPARP
jgi:polyisoprenyl-phosphate glycosyltransferase